MAARIPLNKFRRISQSLNTGLQMVYEVPFDRAGIMLTVIGTNVTPAMHTVTLGVSTINPLNGAPYIEIIKNVEIGAYDAAHLTIGKIVLTHGDYLYATCSGLSAINLTLSILESVNT